MTNSDEHAELVRQRIAVNKKTPDESIERLIEDDVPLVRDAALEQRRRTQHELATALGRKRPQPNDGSRLGAVVWTQLGGL